MKLLRLLRTGKSLVGSSDVAQYRMGDPRAMPVFESKAGEESKVESPKSKVVAAAPKGWFAGLVARLGRLFSKPQKRAIPQFNNPGVQGELSLERVKVMRNDLSDTDLEVVPKKTERPKESAGEMRKANTQSIQSNELKANGSLTTTTPLTLPLAPSEGSCEKIAGNELKSDQNQSLVTSSPTIFSQLQGEREGGERAIEVGGS